MKKMVLLIAAVCFAALCFNGLAENTPSKAPTPSANKLDVLNSTSSGNLSLVNVTAYTAIKDWGLNAYDIGEAVKFTAPKPGWKLKIVQILGWTGLNNTSKVLPRDQNILLEVRDKDLNLLYRMADSQNAYFTSPNWIMRGIDIPAVSITGDFYLVFYDRGAMVIGAEQGNGTGNSYFYDNRGEGLIPAEFVLKNNRTMKVNWVMKAIGN